MNELLPENRPTGRFWFPLFGTLLHAGLVVALFVTCVEYVLPAKRTFDAFGLTLPWPTQTVIKLSLRLSESWPTLVPVFAALGVVDFLVIRRLGRRPRTRAWWVLSIALVLVLTLTAVFAAVGLPLMKFGDALAR